MFLRNLNLFIPFFLVLTTIFSGPIKGLLLFAFSQFPAVVNTIVFTYSPAIIIATILIIAWWRKGLSPTKLNPEKEHIVNSGHMFVAAANFSIPCYLLFEWGTPKTEAVLFVLLVFMVLTLWIIGIVRILSSR